MEFATARTDQAPHPCYWCEGPTEYVIVGRCMDYGPWQRLRVCQVCRDQLRQDLMDEG